MKIGAGVCGAIAAEANVCCWVTGSKRVAMVAGVKHTLHLVRGMAKGGRGSSLELQTPWKPYHPDL